jgi:hypothetical protein
LKYAPNSIFCKACATEVWAGWPNEAQTRMPLHALSVYGCALNDTRVLHCYSLKVF